MKRIDLTKEPVGDMTLFFPWRWKGGVGERISATAPQSGAITLKVASVLDATVRADGIYSGGEKLDIDTLAVESGFAPEELLAYGREKPRDVSIVKLERV